MNESADSHSLLLHVLAVCYGVDNDNVYDLALATNVNELLATVG
jgi:hypothetical protein